MCACIFYFPYSVPFDGCRSHLSVKSRFKMLLMIVEGPGKRGTWQSCKPGYSYEVCVYIYIKEHDLKNQSHCINQWVQTI